MPSTVIQLRQFYASPLGRRVKQRLRQQVMACWGGSGAQETVVGLGYAVPLLRVLERSQPAALMAFMPAAQGAIYWPVHSENHSVLGDLLMPPFAPGSLHRVLMLHALEHVARPGELLNVYWQMLAPGGRLLMVVPNRRGYWANVDNTPFALGTPFSLGQLKELLAEARFTLSHVSDALYAPPTSRKMWLRLWPLLERLGRFCFPGMGGVLILEAEKQIYASIPEPVKDWVPAAAVKISAA